jgi:hypothetical protein
VPIPCEKCTKPVDQHVVVCPHCGDLTGVQSDPIALAEISGMMPLGVEPESPPLPFLLSDKELPATEDDSELPRAIARRRRD